MGLSLIIPRMVQEVPDYVRVAQGFTLEKLAFAGQQ
jgi:hypothetical protein